MTKQSIHIYKDRYVMMLVSIVILCWNLSFYYPSNIILELVLCISAMFLGIRFWRLYSCHSVSYIEDIPDRYIETAVIMIFFVTGLIQSFDGEFNSWFKDIIFVVSGIILGINIKASFISGPY